MNTRCFSLLSASVRVMVTDHIIRDLLVTGVTLTCDVCREKMNEMENTRNS
jgi:hypothetical protein